MTTQKSGKNVGTGQEHSPGRSPRTRQGPGRRTANPPRLAEDGGAVARWFESQIPEGWFVGPPEVDVDGEEILVVGRLPDLQEGTAAASGPGGEADDRAVAEAARVAAFREETRDRRIEIAGQAEQGFGRRVSWGAQCGSTRRLYTTASVPVMTRLRIGDRRVLDTLVAAGVARSRSDALAWCVRLVGEHESEWLDDLRQALERVGTVRSEGPRTI